MYLNHRSPFTPSLTVGALVLTYLVAPPHFGTSADAILALTHAVLAATVVSLPDAGEGTVTVPIKVGELLGARVSVISLTHSVDAIFVLSSPAGGLSVNSGVPVKVGLLIGAAPVTSATPNITVPVAPLTDNTGLFSATNRVVASC